MTKPIVATLTKTVGAYPKGAELGFDSEAKAAKELGEGSFRIDRYQDGTLVEELKSSRSSDAKADKKD